MSTLSCKKACELAQVRGCLPARAQVRVHHLHQVHSRRWVKRGHEAAGRRVQPAPAPLCCLFSHAVREVPHVFPDDEVHRLLVGHDHIRRTTQRCVLQ